MELCYNSRKLLAQVRELLQYKLKNWLARGWELDGYGKGREKVPGMGRKQSKEHSIGGKPSEGLLQIGWFLDDVSVVPGSGSIQREGGRERMP